VLIADKIVSILVFEACLRVADRGYREW